jgi:glycosyltransferase involved in cell wall biosynthesis
MRIVHIVASSPPGNVKGDETHMLHLVAIQRARGDDPVVITDRDGFVVNSCERDGIPVSVVGDFLRGSHRGSMTTTLDAKLKELDAEILHCHELNAFRSAVEAADNNGIPSVITLHVGSGEVLNELATANRSGRKVAVIAVCKAQFNAIQSAEKPGIELHYVPLTSRIPPDRHQQAASGPSKPNLVLVGVLDFKKGIDLAILAMLELRRKRGADCPVLNIYGWGRQGRYFTEVVEVLHLDDLVKFHGVDVGILEKCPSSDVLIVASRKETGPLVVLEAMSRGMPVVATDVGDVREMLPDRRYGRVVPVDSITGLADAIDSVLRYVASGRFDPNVVIKRHRSEYSADKMAGRVAAIYNSALLA